MKKTLFILLLIFSLVNYGCQEKEENLSKNQIKDQIEKANENYKKIKNINYEKISHFLTNSTFFYEKPNKIMFQIYYFNKKKSQIISDGFLFWFWLDTFDKQNVYYSKIEDLDKTRLKRSLHPDVLKTLVWVDELDNYEIENNELVIKEKNYKIKLKLKEGKVISQKIEINSIPVLSVFTEEFQEINKIFVPKKIKVEWHEEKRKETIDLGIAKLNTDINIIEIPKELNKINLKNY